MKFSDPRKIERPPDFQITCQFTPTEIQRMISWVNDAQAYTVRTPEPLREFLQALSNLANGKAVL